VRLVKGWVCFLLQVWVLDVLKTYIIINFRIYEINWDGCKLIYKFILIKIIKNNNCYNIVTENMFFLKKKKQRALLTN
jgi:uncharacterized protein Smg (DUF494 family)